MQNVDLVVYNAGQLLTCASGGKPKRGRELLDLGLIRDGAIAIGGGTIAAVGTSEEILRSFKAGTVIDAGGRVVCPGFVDPHTHIVYAGNRLNEFELKLRGADYLEILASGGGILSTVEQTRAATEEDLVRGSLSRLDKMLACGTTTCEIKTGYGLNTEAELKMLRVIEALAARHVIDIVPTFLAAHTVPSEFKDDPDGYVDLICREMLPQAWEWYEDSRFAPALTPFYCDIFAERNSFDRGQMQRLMDAARNLGFGIKAHVDQFTNLGGSRLGIELGAASIDHLDVISDDEIDLLAASETVGIVIPAENFSGGKTNYAPVRKLIDAGCAVALSTDYNPGSAPCPSIPMVMAIACRYQKLLPAEALNAATINASFAIGSGSRSGSIEVGKLADLLVVNITDYCELSYEFGGPFQAKVIKRGRLVYDGSLDYQHQSETSA